MRIEVGGQAGILNTLKLLKMSPRKRQRVLGQMARKVRVNSRKRLKSQTNLDGTPWKGRKDKKKKKMLKGLSKRMTAKSNTKFGVVSFLDSVTSKIAKEHQEGIDKQMTSAQMKKIYGTPKYKEPATRSMAKALRAAGYKIKKAKGKGMKSPTLKWIMENLNIGKAGLILRFLTKKTKKTSWIIRLPARSFLGATDKEITEMVDKLFNTTLNR